MLLPDGESLKVVEVRGGTVDWKEVADVGTELISAASIALPAAGAGAAFGSIKIVK